MGAWVLKMKKWKEDQEGFTLIELMATITILAIITIPLLSYFSDAAGHNAQSRTKQSAVVTAQDVLEEFKSAPYEITDGAVLATNAPDWTAGAPDANGVYTATRSMTVDDQNFQVSAEITPIRDQVNAAGDTVSYQRAVIGSMDTSKDLLAAETGSSFSKAVLYYYQIHAGKCAETGTAPISSSEMEKYVSRTIVVDVKTNPSKTEELIVRVDYKYSFNSGVYMAAHGSAYPEGISAATPIFEECLESDSIKAEKLNNIYLFYKPLGKADTIQLADNGDVNFNTNVATGQMNLYVVAQSSVPYGEPLPDPAYTNREPGYKMNITSTGSFFTDKIGKLYTNLSSTAGDELGVSALSTKAVKRAGEYTLVESADAIRIADIKVTVTCGGKEYASVTGTKIQN